MSVVAQALLINAIVLFVVLEADIGPHRKIGWFRIARPLVLAGVALIRPKVAFRTRAVARERCLPGGAGTDRLSATVWWLSDGGCSWRRVLGGRSACPAGPAPRSSPPA